MSDLVMYTIADVCAQLKVHERTVYRWLKSGQLRGVKAGKLWRIPEVALEAFLLGPQATETAPALDSQAAPAQPAPACSTGGAAAHAAMPQAAVGMPPVAVVPPRGMPAASVAQPGPDMRLVRIRYNGEPGHILYNEKNPKEFTVEINDAVKERIIAHFLAEREFKVPEAQGKNDYRIDHARAVDNANYFTLALCTLHVNTGVRVEW